MGLAIVVVVMGMAGVALGEVDLGVMKEAKENMDEGKYEECMAKLGKLLAHTSSFEKTTERGKLLAMKGECLLRQKQGQAAQEVFAASAAAYPTKDAKEAAVSAATAELIGKSKELTYVPTTGEGEKKGIGIVESKDRVAAFEAMFRDLLAERQTEMKNVLKPPPAVVQVAAIEEFAGKARGVSNAEVAATGEDKQTKALMTETAAATKKCLNGTITQMTRQVENIATEADKMVTVGKGQRKRGITPTEKNTLTGMATTVGKLTTTIKGLVTTLGTDADYFKQELEDAASLKKKAEDAVRRHKVN